MIIPYFIDSNINQSEIFMILFIDTLNDLTWQGWFQLFSESNSTYEICLEIVKFKDDT